MSDIRGSSFGGLTGFMFGDGGIPRVRRGVRGPLLLRPPGTGGLSRGAGDDILLQLPLLWWLWLLLWLLSRVWNGPG